jgi:hypothetical protein
MLRTSPAASTTNAFIPEVPWSMARMPEPTDFPDLRIVMVDTASTIGDGALLRAGGETFSR